MEGSEAQSGGLLQMGHLGQVGVEGIQGVLVGGGVERRAWERKIER